jgi:3-hydroxybutyryl-CoA dehydrogenase
LADATKDADLIIEATPEIVKLKKQVFRDLDKLCPKHTILASNTSSFSITEIGSATKRPEKVIGTHWFRPPHITPLVEIVTGEATADETLRVTRGLLEKLGKSPIVCKDSPGFVANRMQHVMTNEAIILLQEGIASAEDIDKAVKLGFGFRLSVVGPLEAQDFAGLDTSLHAREYEYKKLGYPRFQPPQLMREKVKAGELGAKTGKGYYNYTRKDISSLIRKRNEQYLKLLIMLGHTKPKK